VIDAHVREAPRAEVQRFRLETQRAFDKSILCLQVLWTQKRALHPDHRLQLPHTDSKGNTRKSAA